MKNLHKNYCSRQKMKSGRTQGASLDLQEFQAGIQKSIYSYGTGIWRDDGPFLPQQHFKRHQSPHFRHDSNQMMHVMSV